MFQVNKNPEVKPIVRLTNRRIFFKNIFQLVSFHPLIIKEM